MPERPRPRLFSFPRDVELAHLDGVVHDAAARGLVERMVDAFLEVVRTRELHDDQLALVVQAASHQEAGVRAFAITRLSVLTHYFKPALDALGALLHHADSDVRLYATSALSNVPTSAMAALLVVPLSDDVWQVRKAAALVAGTLRDAAVADAVDRALMVERDARVRVILAATAAFQTS